MDRRRRNPRCARGVSPVACAVCRRDRFLTDRHGLHILAFHHEPLYRNRFASYVLDGSDGMLSAPTARVRRGEVLLPWQFTAPS